MTNKFKKKRKKGSLEKGKLSVNIKDERNIELADLFWYKIGEQRWARNWLIT